MSEVNGKPEAPEQATVSVGTETQPAQQEQPANPKVEASDEVRSYLKGLGLENASISEELIKVAEAGMKQKASVSKLSLEKEQLLAKMTSTGQDTSIPEPEESQTQPEPTPQPTESAPMTRGVSDNDLFDLSRMITTEFQDIAPLAEDGSIFRELRQLGYFTANGIDKKSVYEYLAQRNSQAKELRELREFKQKYGQPDPNANPTYNAQPGVSLSATGEMSKDMAHAIVLSGDRSNSRYAEALEFLRKTAVK